MIIKPAKKLQGEIMLPGDKSISHRAAMLLAMAEGSARIENFATSEDCSATLDCLRGLGVEITRQGPAVLIKGLGKQGFTPPQEQLDCGNSGTTMRLLAGVLAGQGFVSTLIGDDSLQGRPMKRIIDPLELMGAEIESGNGTAPLKISGKKKLSPIEYLLPIASAQVKSCILLAGLNAEGVSRVRSPKSRVRLSPSRNHTELMFEYLGADIRESFIETGDGFIHEVGVDGNSVLRAKDIYVPSDISSAAFLRIWDMLPNRIFNIREPFSAADVATCI
jgi:3-phosphoshikimate 1-carboxyvinyltransferase